MLVWLESLFDPYYSMFLAIAYSFSLSVYISSVQLLSLTLCDPMNRSMSGLPVHRQLLGFTQNPHTLRQWCHPTSSSFVISFSSCPQSSSASVSFQMSHLFASGGQRIGVSASTSVFPMNTQDWFPLGWTGWVSLQSKGLKSLLQHHSSKASILLHSAFFIV